MSAARKLSPPEELTDGPLLRLYHSYLEETGSKVAAAILADSHLRSAAKAITGATQVKPDCLTIKQAAERLQVSERTVSRMIDNGLRVIRAGKTVRIKPADLEAYLEEQDTRFD
jgi:excisionase family DNA binding protein